MPVDPAPRPRARVNEATGAGAGRTPGEAEPCSQPFAPPPESTARAAEIGGPAPASARLRPGPAARAADAGAGEPPPESEVEAAQRALLDWYDRHRRDLPWRGGPGAPTDPYRVLVSETMLQQTGVNRVIPKYEQFLARFPTLADLAAATPADVIRAWDGLGYNLRALRLHGIARAAVERFGGRLPSDPSTLRTLPGIGPYTAAAIACFAFGAPVATVDTNIRRVLARVWLGRDPDSSAAEARAVWALAERNLARDRPADWNQALMDLGATICTARNPRHLVCPLRDLCRYVRAEAPQRAVSGLALRAAEARPEYTTASSVPHRTRRFAGSTRYYRGRVIAWLRRLPVGTKVDLYTLGRAIKPDFRNEEASWLEPLVQRLSEDGLVALTTTDHGLHIALPCPSEYTPPTQSAERRS